MNNPFIKAYTDLLADGKECWPRGQVILELENYRLDLHPVFDRFTSFGARNMNLDYAKFEMGWYLRGDRFETESISDKAKMWSTIVDTDGGINSNYGQYIFHDQAQYKWVVEELTRDPDSRRAVMTLLNHTHLREDNPDVVCTYSISFRIRENKLNMTIHMRSWDAIWGMTNDVFCFSCIYEIVYNLMKRVYPSLVVGTYVHTADSFHVYQRHFDMLIKLVADGMMGFKQIRCPLICGPDEADYLIYRDGPVKDEYLFTKWLES